MDDTLRDRPLLPSSLLCRAGAQSLRRSIHTSRYAGIYSGHRGKTILIESLGLPNIGSNSIFITYKSWAGDLCRRLQGLVWSYWLVSSLPIILGVISQELERLIFHLFSVS